MEEGAAGTATGGDFPKEDKRSTETQTVSHRVSRVLMAWLNNPRVAMELDRDMLMELKATIDLNVHVGLSYATAAIEMGVELKGPRKVKGCEWWEP